MGRLHKGSHEIEITEENIMPKFRTTNREMTTEALTYAVPYADLQNVLIFENAVAYTCGIYGWNSDIYPMGGNTYISMGYRPCGYRLKDGWIYRALDKYANKKYMQAKTSDDYDALKEEFKELIDLLYRIFNCDYRMTSSFWKEYRDDNKAEYARLIAKVTEITGYDAKSIREG